MTRLIVTLPDSKDAVAAIKQMAKALGGTAKTEATPPKKPRTRLEQEFVDAYKEALAAERGEVQLEPIENLIGALKAKRENAAH